MSRLSSAPNLPLTEDEDDVEEFDLDCGADLDGLHDETYTKAIFQAEHMLPNSFFEFKPNFDKLETIFEKFDDLCTRTKNLNLLVIYAKLRILNREYCEFIKKIEHIATLLEMKWDNVYPQNKPQYRMMILQELEYIPHVLLPLECMPLIEDHEFGDISYRAFLLTNNTKKTPRADETRLEPDQLQSALARADVSALQTAYMNVWRIQDAAKRIESITRQHDELHCVKFDKLTFMTASILAILAPVIKTQSPDFIQDDPADIAAQTQSIEHQATKLLRIHTTSDVASAFVCLEAYLSEKEPSNPALMLVRQARQLIGKSFAECIQILVPSKLSEAYIPIGAPSGFKIAVAQEVAQEGSAQTDQKRTLEVKKDAFTINNRHDVIALLNEIAAFYKQYEPTSPIPLLCEKASALGDQDFLSLLGTLFPQ